MKILHLVKTSQGARWAAEQVAELVKHGHQVAVILPTPFGKMMPLWERSGAALYFNNIELPIPHIQQYNHRAASLREVIEDFKPDIIHSHFFSTTILARMALKRSQIPILFQVPGPLHLENIFFRKWDIFTARKNDFWIASSWAIRNLYIRAGIPEKKIFVSYYGNSLEDYQTKEGSLRSNLLGVKQTDYLIGNISYFYPPKYYLFQRTGLKGHELIFETLNKLHHSNSQIKGVFWGEQWGNKTKYYDKLLKRKPSNSLLPGALHPFDVSKGWRSLDLCLHLPFSENCGGVVEPLLHEIPVLACAVGGIPEIIINNTTGLLCKRDPQEVLKKILWAKSHQELMQKYTFTGKKLIQHTFDVKRTAQEISTFYSSLYSHNKRNFYDPRIFVKTLN